MATPSHHYIDFDRTRNRARDALLLLLALALLCALQPGRVFAATFTAQLDRTRVAEGETVTLQLEASGDGGGNPDLSALDADFDIISQSQGSQFNFINGNASSSRQWRLVLMPKHGGDLTIPALRLGGLKSDPIALKVTAADVATDSNDGAGRPVMVEVEADNEKPYVQGEVVYRVRILSRVPLREASLSDPQAGDAIVERLGEDANYTTQRDGMTYQVIERRYAIFPQHSGKLDIDSPVLAAAIPVQNSQRRNPRDRFFGGNPFAEMQKFLGRDFGAGFPDVGGLFEQTQPLRLRGQNLALDVQAQPAGVQGTWLPAKNLTLSESWSPEPPEFRVGEPVTRAITLSARGASAAQLPDLTSSASASAGSFKSYPDQAQSDTQTQGDDLLATRTQKIALVPTTAGALTLPEVRVPWWDTATGQARVATLPARQIDVLPARAGAEGAAPALPAPTTAASATDNATTTQPAAATPATRTESTAVATIRSSHPIAPSYWPWIAAVAAAGWLVTLILWLRSRRSGATQAPAARSEDSAAQKHRHLTQSRAQLRDACSASDPKAARAALMAWAGARWPDAPPRGLPELAGRLSDTATRTEIAALDRLLYDAGTQRTWDGRAAWNAFERGLDDGARNEERKTLDPLPELYPRHG